MHTIPGTKVAIDKNALDGASTDAEYGRTIYDILPPNFVGELVDITTRSGGRSKSSHGLGVLAGQPNGPVSLELENGAFRITVKL